MTENYNTIAKRKGIEAQNRLREFNLSNKIRPDSYITEIKIINVKDVKECEKELRKMLENYNNLEHNLKENLILYCLIGIAHVHKDKSSAESGSK